MGAWHPVERHSIFPYYHNATNNTLYILGDNGAFTQHHSNLTVRPTFAHEGQPARLSTNAIPTDVIDFGQFKLRNIPNARVAPVIAPPKSFKNYLSLLPYHKQCTKWGKYGFPLMMVKG